MRGLAWLTVYGYMLIISWVMEQGRGGFSALLGAQLCCRLELEYFAIGHGLE